MALRWVDVVADRPFFLFLHHFEPHTQYEPVEPFRSRYADPYDGEVTTLDASSPDWSPISSDAGSTTARRSP